MKATRCILFISAALAAGCSHQDFGRPIVGSLSDMVDSGRPYVEGRGDAEAAKRAQKIAAVLAQWKGAGNFSMDYHVGPDDVLEIAVLSLEEPGNVSRLVRVVGKDGNIAIPWIGQMGVAGQNVRAIETNIVGVLAGRYIKEPQVTVQVTDYRSAPVVMTGAVNRPGIYYLKNDRRTVLEMIAEANGLNPDAGSELLIVRGSSEEKSDSAATNTLAVASGTNAEKLITIDLRQLIDMGDIRQNLWVQKGDVITVLPLVREYVYVLGYVQRPGAFEVRKDQPLGALQAVAMAGGLSPTARAENSWLLRETAEGQEVVPVDLTKIARGTRPPLVLEPGDTLMVGSSFVARLSEFVRPSVGAGVNYSPVP